MLWVLLISALGVLASAWLGLFTDLALIAHALASLSAVLSLPAMRAGTLPGTIHDEPWVWWTVVLGAVSAAITTGPRWFFPTYLTTIAMSWMLVHVYLPGGHLSFLEVSQDTLLVLFLGGGIGGLAMVTREWAMRVDIASSRQIISVIEKAKADAVESEEQRIDALVHDLVLNTFVLAAAAKTDREFETAGFLAEAAIAKLRDVQRSEETDAETNTLGLFTSLRRAALTSAPHIKISIRGANLELISAGASRAIFGATLQSIDNAVKHSKSSDLELYLQASATGVISILVIDKGCGFSVEKIPKNRIGIKGSILSRMELVGGSAKIKSVLDEGTCVSLRWPK